MVELAAMNLSSMLSIHIRFADDSSSNFLFNHSVSSSKRKPCGVLYDSSL